MDALTGPGISADTEALLKLRHLARAGTARRQQLTGMPGGFVSRRRGRGLEADDIRAYFEGDDIRHIDRNVTARTGVPHVRTFRDERDRTILLMADFRPFMLWGTRRAFRSVAAAEALALAGWRAIDAGARVGLYAFGGGETEYVPARGRERGMVAVVGGLVAAHRRAFGQGAAMPLDAHLDKAAALVPPGGTIMLATGLDEPGSAFDAIARKVMRRARLIVILIGDAFERDPPLGRYPYSTGTGGVSWSLVQGARQATGPRQAALEAMGIECVVLEAGSGPEAMEVPDG